ncbi:MAG TPA: SH3 domain-containing protein [Chloroflexota bacterium]|nr:SH3 domain-containing protein [Chloroflexota bacterium]
MGRWTNGRTIALAIATVAALVLLLAPAEATNDLSVGGGATVTADWLNLRGGPGLENPIVDELSYGTSLHVLGGPIADVWWRVSDGTRVGYVSGDWLAPAAVSVDQPTFDLDLSLPYHAQLTSVWCDPADLQSWIELDQGQSLGASYGAQQSFWNWELGHNDGFTVEQWDASPFAVASAAHHWLPGRGFNHFVYDDPLAATATVAWLLANPKYHEPSVATIWWGDHYVLVRGVRATANPYLDNGQAKILGVYVMDPNRGRPSWLGEDRYIPIDAWVTRYLTPVSYRTPGSGIPGDVWQGKYVMIQRDWTNTGPTPQGRVDATPRSYLNAGG